MLFRSFEGKLEKACSREFYSYDNSLLALPPARAPLLSMVKHPPFLAACLLMACHSLALAQAPLAEDAFKSASADSNALVTSVLTWKKIANVTLGLTNGSPPGSTALQADFLAYGKLYASFPTAKLAVGSTLEATLQVRYAAEPSSMNAGLRIGLENLTDPDNSSNTDSQPGYLVFLDPGQAAPKGGSFAVEDGTDGSMGGGKDFRGFGLPFLSTALGTVPHTLIFKVARTDSGIEVSFQCDGGEVSSAVDTSAQPAALNTLLIAVGNTPSSSLIIEKVTINLTPTAKP